MSGSKTCGVDTAASAAVTHRTSMRAGPSGQRTPSQSSQQPSSPRVVALTLAYICYSIKLSTQFPLYLYAYYVRISF